VKWLRVSVSLLVAFMSNRKLALLVELKDRSALKPITKALGRGLGLKSAAEELGVSRVTLYRWGATWDAVGKLLDKHTLAPADVASLGGTTTAKNRKARK
jgi:hypothetical protein